MKLSHDGYLIPELLFNFYIITLSINAYIVKKSANNETMTTSDKLPQFVFDNRFVILVVILKIAP